ncbi:MAG TPA: ABC transporter ATP-binding protein [Methylomirabilota bacterium]|nr:ABC transporter ATP-binding protein [Methylomirabilota bacterium]
MPLLQVDDLHVSYQGRTGPVAAVRGISFALERERLGIVGESGSGKSTIGRAVLGLLPPTATVTAQTLRFHGTDLLRASERSLREIRGRRISMVLQDPKYSLNPVMTVGRQIAESYRVHTRAPAAEARRRALEMLDAVRIDKPERVYDLYPHEVSGGMGQRVMIAMMLVPEPELLIADEPTSALDVTVQAQLLVLINELIARRGMGLILISHNLNLVASFCDRVVVMYAGRIMETCRASELDRARHPYTKGLLACRPLLDRAQADLPQLARDPAWLDGPVAA